MGNDSIEPSEIITNIRQKGTSSPREKVFPPNPYLRLLARFFDYSLFILFLSLLHVLMGAYFPKTLFGHLVPFEFLAWIPVEACLLHFWGTTPGKFLCNIHLKQGRRETLSFSSGLMRSLKVWFRGLGMGIPIVSFFCMFFAFHRLRLLGMMSWDREDNITVSHKSVPQYRIIIMSVFTVICFLGYYNFR